MRSTAWLENRMVLSSSIVRMPSPAVSASRRKRSSPARSASSTGRSSNPGGSRLCIDSCERRAQSTLGPVRLPYAPPRAGRGLVSLLLVAAPLLADPLPVFRPVVRSVPRARAVAVLDGRRVSVDYGRPRRQGRPIFGALVPYGEAWRTVADEATPPETEAHLLFAGRLVLPQGSHALLPLPDGEDRLPIPHGPPPA